MCWFGLVGQMMQKCLRIRGLSPSVSQLRSFSIIHTGFSSVDAELHFGLFPAVKLAGLPFNSSPTDIANFLNGLKPVDIVVQFRSGESTGNLAILFKDAEDAAEALKLNRKYIGQRYVTVMRCRRDEYFHIVAQDLAARRPKYPTRDFKLAAAAIRIEGLSYEALPFDVYRFCSKFIPREDYVKICATSEGLSTGVAYVEMRDLETAKLAQETLHHKFIGIRKVTVALASPQEASLPPNKFFT